MPPTIQPSQRRPTGGISRKVISSRKPTWTARTTVLEIGLNAAVTTWKVEKAIATAKTAGGKRNVPCCRSASASETGWVIAWLAKKNGTARAVPFSIGTARAADYFSSPASR